MQKERFARLHIVEHDIILKVEMINDVPAHTGEITIHPTLGKLDSAENILASKVTALFGRKHSRLKLKEIARQFGLGSYSSISSMVIRMEALLSEDRNLSKKLGKARKELGKSQAKT